MKEIILRYLEDHVFGVSAVVSLVVFVSKISLFFEIVKWWS